MTEITPLYKQESGGNHSNNILEVGFKYKHLQGLKSLSSAYNRGLDEAAFYIESCGDHGDKEKAYHIRSLKK